MMSMRLGLRSSYMNGSDFCVNYVGLLFLDVRHKLEKLAFFFKKSLFYF